MRFVLLISTVLLCAPYAAAQPRTLQAFTNVRIIPIDGEPIESGTLLIEGKTIKAVGNTDDVAIPDGTPTVDLGGKTIMPGLICTHSHIGGFGAADGSGPIQPGVRIMDSLNVHDSGFKRALAGGLTTLNIMPGSGHLISGQTIYVKLRYQHGTPKTISELAYRKDDAPLGGLKMANGTNSQKEPPFPGTRGRAAFLVRAEYIKAREYQAKINRADGDPDKMPSRDLHLETLVEAMNGTRIVHHHTHRHDDIMTVIRLAQEFGFRVVLHHVSEGWKVADEIAKAGVPCSMIVLDSPGGKLEARDLSLETGRILEEAGVRTAFHTDDPITDSRYLFRQAALAVRAGMSRKAALEGLTIAGAEMLDLDDRVGTLTPGKDADFVVLSGDPLSIYTKVEQTYVEGGVAFDRTEPSDLLYAVGGFGAGHDQSPYYCCFGNQVIGDN